MTDPALLDHPLVFMHGRNSFHLTDAERRGPADVRRSRRGGVGRRDLRQPGVCRLLPPRNGGDLSRSRPGADPASDPLFSTAYGGFDLAQVSRRDPQPRGTNSPLSGRVSRVPPELEGIRLHDRYGVVFSQFDLSCALEKRDSLECRGYTREDAARIAPERPALRAALTRRVARALPVFSEGGETASVVQRLRFRAPVAAMLREKHGEAGATQREPIDLRVELLAAARRLRPGRRRGNGPPTPAGWSPG